MQRNVRRWGGGSDGPERTTLPGAAKCSRLSGLCTLDGDHEMVNFEKDNVHGDYLRVCDEVLAL